MPDNNKQPSGSGLEDESTSSESSSLPPSEQLYIEEEENERGDETSQSITISSANIASEILIDEPKGSTANNTTHHHFNLPAGWACNVDQETGQYEFQFQGSEQQRQGGLGGVRDEAVMAKTPTADDAVQTSRRPTMNMFECPYGYYHFPSTPTPSMISELAKEVQKSSTAAGVAQMKPKTKLIGYGKSKLTMLSVEEEQAQRLNDMFPTATRPIVDQMIRIYHGREGLIKAALISLGYKRSSEYSSQQATSQSPIMLMMSKPASKKLFDKLAGYFPDKDENLIKNLMYKHKEVEHEIISVLVESGQQRSYSRDDRETLIGSAKPSWSRSSRRMVDNEEAIMKLRYLKFLFPTCEEIELYHLLHCHNLNSQKVIEQVEKKGHKRINTEEMIKNRKTDTQKAKAHQAALAAKEKAPQKNLVEIHRNRTKPVVTNERANNLKDNLRKHFEVDQFPDGILFKALEASDYNENLAKRFLEERAPINDKLYKQRYKIHFDEPPKVVLFPCKGVQKGQDTSFMSVTGNEHVSIPIEVIECENAIALRKIDASTFTEEDFDLPRFTHAKGKAQDLAVGSKFKDLEVKDSLKHGSSESLRKGSQYKQILADDKRRDPNWRAQGQNKLLVQGRRESLSSGHNPKLIQRLHPFFEKPQRFVGLG